VPTPAKNKAAILDRSVAYLKGIGPAKANLLAEELLIRSLNDLLHAYPFRYVDRTKFHRIIDIIPNEGAVQVKGVLKTLSVKGDGRATRLVGRLRDESGAALELVWFRGINVLQNMFIVGEEYICYGVQFKIEHHPPRNGVGAPSTH